MYLPTDEYVTNENFGVTTVSDTPVRLDQTETVEVYRRVEPVY